MKAVLMAGGFGTRIQPLTHKVPKPMVSLMNRPMMEHILLSLKDAGINEVVVLLYHMPEVIKDYFGDGSRLGMQLEYVLPDDDFGTAGAVKFAEELLDSTFVVISGDLVTDFDLGGIIEFHREKSTPVTITLTSVPNPLQFGVVITDGDGRILRFLEKPSWGEVFSDTVNTGIYVLEPEIFKHIPEGSPFDFSKDLFPIFLKENTPIYGFNAKGYWRDVGNPDSYREAVQDIIGGEVELKLDGTRTSPDGAELWAGKGCAYDETVKFQGKVVLGDGVEIGSGATVSNTVIGEGSRIGPGAQVSNSVIWEEAKVGGGTVMDNAVLCDAVVLGNDVVMEKGAIIAGGTDVGDKVAFEKDVMVWPDKKIESGSVLSANMVWGDKWKKSVFEGGVVRGNTNVELSPEFAAKMGAALGSTMPVGSKILVGRDYLKASRMLKRAFLGGILSTGVDVHDVKMAPLPVMRYKLSGFGEEAGVYFQQSPSGTRSTDIVFYDGEGNLIDTNIEKSIERIFFKENFRRVDHSEVGGIQEIMAIPDFYKDGFLRDADAEVLRTSRFRVVLDLENGTTGDYLPSLLNSMGCQPVVLNAYPDPRRLMRHKKERRAALEQVGEIVKTLEADVGFCMSPCGQELYLVDDKGVVRSEHQTLLFIMSLLGRTSAGATKVFLPVTAPRVLDSMPGLRVTRGKATSIKTSDMHDYTFVNLRDGRYCFPNFLHSPDAMFAVAKILEHLSRVGMRVSEIFDELPDYSYVRREVPCQAEKKGLAMRRMSEDSVDKDADFTDGIQVTIDDNSILLLPDPYRPVLMLVAEGSDPGKTEALADEYESKFAEWLKE